ncbi:hypothetical protein C5D60_10050 [Rathayibacter toxicus]|nr:hypothetical protein APU90_06935 [Rathayibacter toxicus]PPI36186.1 hypothetical protein C5D60_10050 [Rathayibacter toxicus]
MIYRAENSAGEIFTLFSEPWAQVPEINWLHRRTLVKGMTWTVPLAATAIATPAFAASAQPTLKFTNGPYSVGTCQTLKDVIIQSTTDGTTPSPAGTTVSVTLPSGLIWSDGTTGTKSFTTDSNGQVVLSGIKADSTSGTKNINASSGGTSASAPVDVTKTADKAWLATNNGPGNTIDGILANSTPLAEPTIWRLMGHHYHKSTEIASNVFNAAGYNIRGQTGDYVTYTTAASCWAISIIL